MSETSTLARLQTPDLQVEAAWMADAIQVLTESAFGPGRLAKTAERLRERNQMVAGLCFAPVVDHQVAGSVRVWPIRIGGHKALFLGPIVVDPAWRHAGLGARLVHRVIEAAKARGDERILLVGDLPFFGPLGFTVVPAGRVHMPGPVNPGRLLWMALAEGALEGVVGTVAVG